MFGPKAVTNLLELPDGNERIVFVPGLAIFCPVMVIPTVKSVISESRTCMIRPSFEDPPLAKS